MVRGMTDQEIPSVGEPPPAYMIFLLVFFFFIMGLLGFFICHILKKKGYRCELEEDEEDCEDKLGTNEEDESDDSQDTVEQILKCIIENEANMEAFKEMLGSQNVCEHHDQRLRRKESVGGLPPHHHTVHLGDELGSCVHCMQGHILKTRRRSRMVRSKVRPREQTVLSVGRFRVTHMEKKSSLQSSMNLPTPKPGDLSNDTTLSDIRREFKDISKKPQEEYNIRNMFENTGATHGKIPNADKRKKSVTLLGFCKGNDPVVTKAGQEIALEDKEGSTTADQLSVSPVECLSSVVVSPADSKTALDENSNKGSVKQIKEITSETIPKNENIHAIRTGIINDDSHAFSRFSVVQTEKGTIITASSNTKERQDQTTQNNSD